MAQKNNKKRGKAMQGFINVVVEGGLHRLTPIDKILSVFELRNGRAFIETQINKCSGYGFYTQESYSEVVEKMEEAAK